MNLVGKIFTVVVFLMSMVFSTVSLMVYSAHASRPTVKKLVTDRSNELMVEKKLNDDLQKERKSLEDELKREIDMAQSRLAALENQYKSLRQERDANNKSARSKEDEINALALQVRDSHKELERLRGDAEKLRGEIKSTVAQRDENFQKVLQRTDEFHNEIAELERLQQQNRILMNELQEIGNISH